ncbi:unnamed protein product, partial [Brassica napus]
CLYTHSITIHLVGVNLSQVFFFCFFLSLWNRLHFTLVITATVCCWLMWAIVYIAQMKPLIVPILSEVE